MISVTGAGLSRARLGDHFSTYSRFAFRAFLDRNDQPSRTFRASTRDYSSFVGVTRDALGLEDELLLFPVIVVDAGAVEALDHFGGAGTGLDGLEDAEGDERAPQSVIQSAQVPEVMSLRYSLPTCVMRARICVFAAKLSTVRRPGQWASLLIFCRCFDHPRAGPHAR